MERRRLFFAPLLLVGTSVLAFWCAAPAFTGSWHKSAEKHRKPWREGNPVAMPAVSARVPASAAAAAAAAGTAAARREVRLQLLAACASTCRGQCGTDASKAGALQLVQALEALNPTQEPAREPGLIEGEWRLIFASEDVTRSSPFFWGWRKLLQGVPDPFPVTRALFGTEELSDSIFAVTDGIPMKVIGEATQTLLAGKLVNKVMLKVYGVGETLMTTTCRYEPGTVDGGDLKLTIETTQAMDSTLPVVDSFVFPSEAFLGDSSRVLMRITYLDDDLRVSRTADDQVFVYSRSM